MTVQELMDVLGKLDLNKEVFIWNPEWDIKEPIDEIEVNQDGDIIIL